MRPTAQLHDVLHSLWGGREVRRQHVGPRASARPSPWSRSGRRPGSPWSRSGRRPGSPRGVSRPGFPRKPVGTAQAARLLARVGPTSPRKPIEKAARLRARGVVALLPAEAGREGTGSTSARVRQPGLPTETVGQPARLRARVGPTSPRKPIEKAARRPARVSWPGSPRKPVGKAQAARLLARVGPVPRGSRSEGARRHVEPRSRHGPAFHVGRIGPGALDTCALNGGTTVADGAALDQGGTSSSVTFRRSRGMRNSKVSRSGAAPRITSFLKWTARWCRSQRVVRLRSSC